MSIALHSNLAPRFKVKFFAPLFISFLFLSAVMVTSILPRQVAAAPSQCEGNIEPTEWNESVSRHAMVPHYNNNFDYYPERGRGDMVQVEIQDEQDDVSNYDTTLHPEEVWMYGSPYFDSLDTFDTNQFLQLAVGNDSAGAIRLNLSVQHRTTFCVQIVSPNASIEAPNVDVYLMTASEYQKYEYAYTQSHDTYQDWYWEREWDDDPDPPEWQNFDFTSWKTFRDVYAFENTKEVTFSVSLDSPEAYTSIFGDVIWDEFYLVIDTWDNAHVYDAEAEHTIAYADVTILSSERSFILPNWTVSLVFFIFTASLVAIPIVLNFRYMKAGIGTTTNDTFVPTISKEYTEPSDLFPGMDEEQ